MKCNWCNQGEGRNYTRDKNGRIFYYYCQKCICQIECEIIPPKLIEEFLEDLEDLEDLPTLDFDNSSIDMEDLYKLKEKWEKRKGDKK